MPAQTVRLHIRIGGEDKWVDVDRKKLLRLHMGRQLAEMIQSMVKTIHRTERSEKVDLDTNPQFQEIYRDPNPDLRTMSSAQVGKTLYGVVRHFAAARLGLNIGYIMPTEDARNRFIKEKINPTIQAVPDYMERMGAAGLGSVKIKRFRNDTGGFTNIFYPGCNSAHDMRSFSADAINVDEYDFCPRENLHLYPARMNYSNYALTYETSTPTLPGDPPNVPAAERSDNIHSKVLEGTDKHYHIKCDHCDFEQELEWTKHIVQEDLDSAGRLVDFRIRDPLYEPGKARDVHPVCLRCHKPFSRLKVGRWIAFNPTSQISSYTINRLNSPMGKSIAGLVKTYAEAIGNPTKMQVFYNYDIGRPFAAGNVKFTDELFKRCALEGYHALETCDRPSSAGIDVNVPFFDVQCTDYPEGMSCRARVTWAGKIQGEESLIARIKAMGVRFVCIDQQPELNTATRLQDEFMKAGIYCTLVRYSSHPASKMITVSKAAEFPHDPPLQVTVDRTGNIDAHYEDMLLRRLGWPANWASLQEGRVRSEYLKPVRQVEKDENGVEHYGWVGKPDHSLHAGVLNRIAGILGASFLYSRGWDTVVGYREDLSEPEAKEEKKPEAKSGGDEVLMLEG